ncbi:MAG: hypothetical protein KatS3mg087_0173 [Patescibacteria group bacterium]|nr:MAG: hypothetical protein KatS3mg087_0173 [Patescibacteria group bacterium]
MKQTTPGHFANLGHNALLPAGYVLEILAVSQPVS